MKALSISAVLMASLLATVPAMSQTPTCPVAGNATMGLQHNDCDQPEWNADDCRGAIGDAV